MAYADQASMVLRYGSREIIQLTDIEEPFTGAIVPAVLTRALDRASGMVDSYLVGRVPTPMASPPEAIRTHCESLARYYLSTAEPGEVTRADFDAAIRYLEKVADGKIPVMPPEQAPAPAGVGPVLFNAGSKVFGRDADTGGL